MDIRIESVALVELSVKNQNKTGPSLTNPEKNPATASEGNSFGALFYRSN